MSKLAEDIMSEKKQPAKKVALSDHDKYGLISLWETNLSYTTFKMKSIEIKVSGFKKQNMLLK